LPILTLLLAVNPVLNVLTVLTVGSVRPSVDFKDVVGGLLVDGRDEILARDRGDSLNLSNDPSLFIHVIDCSGVDDFGLEIFRQICNAEAIFEHTETH
jgi:hypothetical protein